MKNNDDGIKEEKTVTSEIRTWKITVIKQHQYYEGLEEFTDEEIDEIFEELLDWIEE